MKMKRFKVDLSLKTEEQKKSVAKLFHDTAKTLVAAAVIDGVLKNSFARPLVVWCISAAFLCIAAGLRVEETINDKEGR